MSDELTFRTQASDLPAFMQDAETGTENFGQYIQPPRIKVIQPTSKGEYADKFSPGDAVLIPQNILVVSLERDQNNRPQKKSNGIIFTPLFFFTEFCSWNPLEAKGTGLPAIRERSFDYNSPLARKCRDPELRKEPCPEVPGKQISNIEHLNFVIMIHQEGLNAMPALLGFSRSEFRYGANFMSLCKMRLAPMYGCKFLFRTQHRENQKGQWFGIDVENPPENIGGFITNVDTFEFFKSQYNELKKAHQDRSIVVNYDAEEVESQVLEPGQF